MTTQEDWRLRNVIRSVTFISGDSSFPWYIEVSLHCNNLRRKVIKEWSTKPQTSVREINSNKGAIGDIYVVWSAHTMRVLAFIAFHSLFIFTLGSWWSFHAWWMIWAKHVPWLTSLMKEGHASWSPIEKGDLTSKFYVSQQLFVLRPLHTTQPLTLKKTINLLVTWDTFHLIFRPLLVTMNPWFENYER